MSPRTLVIDIERIPGMASVPFWGLSDYKFRRIGYEMVTSWPATICFAWRWYGERKIDFASVWGDGNEGLIRKAVELYDEADVVSGHNLDGFDTKHLRGAALELGLKPPSPVRSFDTLKVARKEFGFESNRLDALCLRLGIPAKVDKYNVQVALAAVGGHVPSQRKIERYNKGDVHASTGLLTKFAPWGGSINYGAYTALPASEKGAGALVCVNLTCGSPNVERRGFSHTTSGRYQRFVCNECGRWGKSAKNEGLSGLRLA